MAGSAKKSTKKFGKKHLRDTIDRRREFAKVKQRHQLKEKKKAKNAAKQAAEEEEEQTSAINVDKQNGFEAMDVDDFFAGGFDIPQTSATKSSKNKDVPPKTGKRKRTEQAGGEAPSIESEDEDIQSGDTTNASGSESEMDDMDAHVGQLEALKEKDPEFYKYLQENDAELLEFGDHGDLAEVDGLSESDEEESIPRKKKKTDKAEEGTPAKTLQLSTVQQWQRSMSESNSLRATRQAVLAFRTAAYVDEEDAQDRRFNISDPDVYHQVLVTALEHVPKVLNHHIPVRETAGRKVRVSMDSKKFKTLTPLIKSHTSSIHQLLTNLSDAAALRLTLSSITPMLPYLLQFRKLLKVIIKTVVGHWSDSSNSEATRISAFLVLRRLMVIGDAGIREAVLKATYEGIVKGSRSTTVHTLAGINLMKNSAAELWGLDQDIAYTTGFTSIRQLAIHLRSSITNPTKDSYKTVYNWQYVHSLDFWSRMLSAHCDSMTEAKAGKQSVLRPLIYPVVQITIGAMRLIPTAQYFPLRFQLTRALLRLSLATGTYIPLASVLLEVLLSSEMKTPPKASTLKPLEFSTCIRAPKTYLRTRIYQDGVAEEVSELLSEFFVLWTKNIAFPELSLPVIVMLKRWLKEVSSRSLGNKNVKINQMFALLVQKVEANSRWIEERRSKVTFTPKDRAEVEGFLKDTEWDSTPLGAFVKTQRAQRTERAKILERSRREERQRKDEKGDEEADQAMVDGGSEDEESSEAS
ncbi:ribosome assembly protein Noc2 [Coccidioides immitis RS]|uniref:Ribosome assembly protein Noc2 n=3 Tax=Coccidioides immitis TaxID=5501 RepID=J3KAI1_COCIM|nr:ribosome assembly protein Noc2 [Coccidioides immitis RS]EAS32030.3 ribosome assembly protein Noc2 [Coccidioides immitis RS]KMP07219.1 nucleolar complex protein 2 [Coccidioides immitis RMSCC 2394]KMU82294.1 nucleolar complex protein 2 [Coccidioides immitis H538.4]TPX19219.1 Nucleolar Complex 2 protein [Coccidioides immitis]